MKLSVTIDSINPSYCLADLHLIPCLDVHRLQLAIKRKVVSMLHKHTLVVSRHHQHLANRTAKHSINLRTLAQSYIYTIVRREFKILVYRMEVFSEASHHRTVGRPRQLTFVLSKLGRQLMIDFRFLSAF